MRVHSFVYSWLRNKKTNPSKPLSHFYSFVTSNLTSTSPSKKEKKKKRKKETWLPRKSEYGSWESLRGCLIFCFFDITHHSLLNFRYSSLKIPKFPKPPVWHLNSSPIFQFQKLQLGFTKKKKKKISPFVKHCSWVCGLNYENAIGNWVLGIKNT